MLGLLKLIPAPARAWVALVAVAAIFSAGTWSGWQARDYFSDRKELKQWQAAAAGWQTAAEKYAEATATWRGRAVDAEGKRQNSRARSNRQASTVNPATLTTFETGKCNADTNTCSCERTDRCHWLQLNAAYDGADAPAECSYGLPDDMQGQFLPPAIMDSQGDGTRSPGH